MMNLIEYPNKNSIWIEHSQCLLYFNSIKHSQLIFFQHFFDAFYLFMDSLTVFFDLFFKNDYLCFIHNNEILKYFKGQNLPLQRMNCVVCDDPILFMQLRGCRV